jgi:endonuclease/exonuclease/phosphatase (EEP) superfamily protein YafD
MILTGDFNTGTTSEAFKLLTKDMRDATPTNPTGTFHGFRGTSGADRIDWILYRGKVSFKAANILRMNDAGRYPSDHFPVSAAFSVR